MKDSDCMLGLLVHFDKLFDFFYPEGLEGKPREKSSTPKNADWGHEDMKNHVHFFGWTHASLASLSPNKKENWYF